MQSIHISEPSEYISSLEESNLSPQAFEWCLQLGRALVDRVEFGSVSILSESSSSEDEEIQTKVSMCKKLKKN